MKICTKPILSSTYIEESKIDSMNRLLWTAIKQNSLNTIIKNVNKI